jgi:hypothetical protein
MKKINIRVVTTVLVSTLTFGLIGLAATSSIANAAQSPVDLQTATPFAILAGTPGITDAGNASVINGSVGLSPATGAGIGLLCTQVTGGTIYSVDATGPLPCRVTNGPLMVTAKNHLDAAFTDAAGRTPVTTVPTELGGTTKIAGVYDSSSTTFGITAGAGPLVIDGQGDPSSVFIFEMGFNGTGLNVGPGSTVSLINGASECNIFWKVDTAAINTTAAFKGNVLALNSISVANGATIQGRLLARNGNVSLINDTINAATCTGTSGGSGSGGSGSSNSVVPKLPNTGAKSMDRNAIIWSVVAVTGVIVTLLVLYFTRKKRVV